MSEINQKIIDMILKNASVNEISKVTGLSNKQLFHRLNMLRIKGYNFSRKYYYDGEIVYKLQKGLSEEKEISLLTSPKDKDFKAVFISDLHLSNKADRVDLLKRIYEFCSKKGINIIINGGDIIDGFIGGLDSKKIQPAEEQIQYLLKNYPYDRNILNFVCLGNHDYSLLKELGQNLETILSIKRHDIISLGYGIGKLNIKNEEILIKHFSTPISKEFRSTPERFVLMGHTHRSQNVNSNNQLHIYIPTLSNMQEGKDKYPFPSFINTTISFDKGYFSNIVLEQYIFVDNTMYKVNESHYNLGKGKNICQNTIKYEEDRVPYKEEKVNVLKKEETGPSQIQKFNRKYSK